MRLNLVHEASCKHPHNLLVLDMSHKLNSAHDRYEGFRLYGIYDFIDSWTYLNTSTLSASVA